MSLRQSIGGDEYYTPEYVVDMLVPYLLKAGINRIWCPCDKDDSEYVKVLSKYFVVHNTHIDNGQDFLTYKPDFEFDAIITNPPFSIKNKIVSRCISFNKPWALLLSATCVQSASLIQILSECDNFQFIMFDKRISYSGDRPPFPSWYFTDKLLNTNEFYIYEDDPKKMYKEWVERTPQND